MAEAKQILFSVTRKDLRRDFFRAGGKGGQKQNKTSSACRITHAESGAVGESREERSQAQNQKNAFRRLVDHSKFRAWVRLKAAAVLQGFRDIEDKVDRMLHPSNLRVETLLTYTCDGCGRVSGQLVAPAIPENWEYAAPDTHCCPSCRSRHQGISTTR